MRIADWVRPTRQVGQINGQTITDSITHPVDTYVRPYAYRDRSLQTITEALDRWSPTFTNLAVQARDQKFKRDVAEGMALMNELTAKGIDPLDVRMPEIREMVKNGLGGKLAQLNRAHEHGINIVQMETAAKGLQGAADDWFKNATFEKDGVQYHVYEMNDPVEFEKAFREFAAKRWFDITGGQYDARLFNEKYGPTMNEVRQNLEKQYISYKGKMKILRANQTYSEMLNQGLMRQLENGQYRSTPNYVTELAKEFNYVRERMSQNTTPTDANEMLKDYIIRSMIGKTSDQIATIREAAMNVPMFWSDVDKSLEVERTAQYQDYYYRTSVDREYRQMKQQMLEARHEQTLNDMDKVTTYIGDPASPDFEKRVAEMKIKYANNPEMRSNITALERAGRAEYKARQIEWNKYWTDAKKTGGTQEDNERFHDQGFMSDDQFHTAENLRKSPGSRRLRAFVEKNPTVIKELTGGEAGGVGWAVLDATSGNLIAKEQKAGFGPKIKAYQDAVYKYVTQGLINLYGGRDKLPDDDTVNEQAQQLIDRFAQIYTPEQAVESLNIDRKGASTEKQAKDLVSGTPVTKSKVFIPFNSLIAAYYNADEDTKKYLQRQSYEQAMLQQDAGSSVLGTINHKSEAIYNKILREHPYYLSDGRRIMSMEQLYNLVVFALPEIVMTQKTTQTPKDENGRKSDTATGQQSAGTGTGVGKTEQPKSEPRPNPVAINNTAVNTDTVDSDLYSTDTDI